MGPRRATAGGTRPRPSLTRSETARRRYVGDYTEANVELLRSMNKKKLADVDLVQPGTVLVVPDNRRNVFEPDSPMDRGGASDVGPDGNILSSYAADDRSFEAARDKARKRLARKAKDEAPAPEKEKEGRDAKRRERRDPVEVARDSWLAGRGDKADAAAHANAASE